MTETTQTFQKYLVYLLSANNFRKKYTDVIKCNLYLEGKPDTFEKF